MALIPYTADEIRERYSDPKFPFSKEHAAILYDAEKAKPFSQKLGEFGEGAVTGIKHIAGTTVKGVKEVAANPDLGKIAATGAEGFARGSQDLGEMAATAGRKIRDTVSETVTGADRAQQIQNLYDRMVASRGNRPVGQQVINELAPYTYPTAAEAVGNVLDPSSLIPGVGVGKIAGKVGAVGSKASNLAKKAAVTATEATGRVVKNVASAPRRAAASVAEKAIGPEAAAKVEKAVSTFQNMALPIGGSTGNPVAGAVAGLRVAEGVGVGLEKGAQVAGKVLDTPGVSIGDKLKRLRADPTAPQWMRVIGDLSQRPAGRAALGAATLGKDIAKGSVEGAAVGGVLGAVTAENAQELGQAVGGGVALGGQARAVTAPLHSLRRAVESRKIDVANVVQQQLAEGVDPAWLAKNVDDALMLRIAQASRVLEGKAKIRIADGATFDAQAKSSAGAAGGYNPETKTLWVVPERARNKEETFLHEFTHALFRHNAETQPQVRQIIRDALDEKYPGQVEQIVADRKREYVAGMDDVKADKALQDARIELLDNQSAARSGGDRDAWIYEEMFADSASRTLHGVNLEGSLGFMALKIAAMKNTLEALGLKKASFAKSPSAIFKTPEFKALHDSPALRKLVYDVVRERAKFLTGVSKMPDAVPGLPMTKEMAGKHEAFPLKDASDAKGRKGNDFVYVGEDGNVHNRTAAEVKQIEKGRASEVEAALALDNKPVAELNDPDDTVRLRKTISGLILRTGKVLPDWFYNLRWFGAEAKANAKLFEQLIKTGETASLWYQAVGTGRGEVYRESVRKLKGNLSASQRTVLPLGFTITKTGETDIAGRPIKTGGNTLVVLMDMTAADKKAFRWQAEGKLDALWGGDQKLFLDDLRTYIKNHAEGRPGADSIGEQKRDALNTLVIGQNVTHLDKNPLRVLLRGEDKGGIVRTFRLDRIEAVKPTGDVLGAGNYDKKVLNLSPDTTTPADNGLSEPRAVPTETPEVDFQADNARVIGPTLFSIRTYHGTPHTVDKFSTDKIGTGEGAQVYGWGLYFAENKNVAQSYQENLSLAQSYDGKVYKPQTDVVFERYVAGFLEGVRENGFEEADRQAGIEAYGNPKNSFYSPEMVEWLRNYDDSKRGGGNLYSVELNVEPHELLDWDAPLSQQPEQIKSVLNEYQETLDGKSVYAKIAMRMPAELGKFREQAHRGASEFLHSLGIKGIRYKDQGSRGKSEGTYNYVIFDDKDARIIEKNGQPVTD